LCSGSTALVTYQFARWHYESRAQLAENQRATAEASMAIAEETHDEPRLVGTRGGVGPGPGGEPMREMTVTDDDGKTRRRSNPAGEKTPGDDRVRHEPDRM